MATNSFYPDKAFINAITNETQAVVTFTANHEFTLGEIVSFRVTPDFGMSEINRKRARILAITDDSITVQMDTQTYTPFSFAKINDPQTTPPHAVASSSGVVPSSAIPKINLVDAFDNRRV